MSDEDNLPADELAGLKELQQFADLAREFNAKARANPSALALMAASDQYRASMLQHQQRFAAWQPVLAQASRECGTALARINKAMKGKRWGIRA